MYCGVNSVYNSEIYNSTSTKYRMETWEHTVGKVLYYV